MTTSGATSTAHRACVFASREVLSRFVKFRRFQRIVYCCRLVDFCAFTASMALVLANLISHGHPAAATTANAPLPGNAAVAATATATIPDWQRMVDRALIESVVELLDEINTTAMDTVTLQTTEVTRQLLALEEEVASGNCVANAGNVDSNDRSDDADSEICIDIPYLGTVCVTREAPLSQPVPPVSLHSTDTLGMPGSTSGSSPAAETPSPPWLSNGHPQPYNHYPALDIHQQPVLPTQEQQQQPILRAQEQQPWAVWSMSLDPYVQCEPDQQEPQSYPALPTGTHPWTSAISNRETGTLPASTCRFSTACSIRTT